MTSTQPQRETGRHGLTSKERPDPIGYAVAVLNRLDSAALASLPEDGRERDEAAA